MRKILAEHTGTPLDLAAFRDEFNRQFPLTGPQGFWKLESRQTYQEPDSLSLAAYNEGRHADALTLLLDRQDELETYYRDIEQAGFYTRRVRLVTYPISHYLRWELGLLRIRHQLGGLTHVINPDQHPELRDTPQPDVIVLGNTVAYELHYTHDGLHTGATRHTDPQLITASRDYISTLFTAGEPVDTFIALDLFLHTRAPGGNS